MNLLNELLQYVQLKKRPAPNGLCPNCWGRQEYGGDFFEAMKLENITTNNIEERKGWIQAYSERYLLGIQLKAREENLVCPRCEIGYSKEQS